MTSPSFKTFSKDSCGNGKKAEVTVFTGLRRAVKRRVFLLFSSIMYTYRIRYTVIDNDHEYADEFFVSAECMSNERAAQELADAWPGSPEEKALFRKELLENDYADFFCDDRAIADLSWEEMKPIVVTVRGGVVQNVSDIPEGLQVNVVDWDSEETDDNGDPVPSVDVWTHREISPTNDGPEN